MMKRGLMLPPLPRSFWPEISRHGCVDPEVGIDYDRLVFTQGVPI